MINYNGTDLTDVADVSIEDIAVSPIQLNPVARSRALEYGMEFIRKVGGTRKITITFALLMQNIDKREAALQKIRNWCRSDVENPLFLPQFDDRYLVCTCTQMPDTSYRKWWENKLRLEFTCFDNPFWTSDELKEVNCGTTFSIGGTAPPLVTIERKGSKLSNATYATSSAAMTFKTIPSGTMTIDLNRQTADVGGSSIMKYYVPTSTWITLKQGNNRKITGNGKIKFRERWV